LGNLFTTVYEKDFIGYEKDFIGYEKDFTGRGTGDNSKRSACEKSGLTKTILSLL
jgi:hypothetical protein